LAYCSVQDGNGPEIHEREYTGCSKYPSEAIQKSKLTFLSYCHIYANLKKKKKKEVESWKREKKNIEYIGSWEAKESNFTYMCCKLLFFRNAL